MRQGGSGWARGRETRERKYATRSDSRRALRAQTQKKKESKCKEEMAAHTPPRPVGLGAEIIGWRAHTHMYMLCYAREGITYNMGYKYYVRYSSICTSW